MPRAARVVCILVAQQNRKSLDGRKRRGTMHVQIINFQLKGMTDTEYRKVCDDLAPAFASVPGLMAKVWLADSSANTYGGVYLWRDRKAMEEYCKTELFQSVASHPNLAEITSTDYEVIEAPTRVCRGLIGAR
jgi:quinol monooxygenase YgiN